MIGLVARPPRRAWYAIFTLPLMWYNLLSNGCQGNFTNVKPPHLEFHPLPVQLIVWNSLSTISILQDWLAFQYVTVC